MSFWDALRRLAKSLPKKQAAHSAQGAEAMTSADKPTDCLVGPVEIVNGEMVLRIPVEVCPKIVPLAKGWGSVEDGILILPIAQWLADKIGLRSDGRAGVGIKEGKLTLWAE